jgi:hypothetical protein
MVVVYQAVLEEWDSWFCVEKGNRKSGGEDELVRDV